MSNLKAKISQITKNKDARILASNFVWLSVLKVIGYIFPLITLPYLSRVIGVDGFGEIAFAVSIMIFFETFVDFGFNYTATRDVARCRDDIEEVSNIFSNVLWSKLLLMFVGFGVLCALVYIIPMFRTKQLLLFFTFLYIPGHIFFPDWFFQAMEKMKYITILNVLSKALFTALIFVVIKDKEDYIWQPLLTAVGYLVSGLIAMGFILKKFKVKIVKPNIQTIWASIKGSANMFVSLICPNLYTNFSTVLLRTTCGEVATGLYDAGYKFISIIDQLFQVLSRTFYPFLARKIDKHQLYTYISGSFSVLASIGLYVCANTLVKIFYTPEFTDAVWVIKILSIAPFSLFLMNTYGVNYLVLVGKDRLYRNIIIVYSVIGFMLTLFVTPKWSYVGMAFTITTIWLLRGITTYIFAIKHKREIKRGK